MSPAAVFFLSVSMSVDAFAVAVGRGTVLDRAQLGRALRIGAVFGLVEGLTPFLGWLAGIAASDWVAHVDHWIAFCLLGLVGIHMIHNAFSQEGGEGAGRPSSDSPFVLLATAFGTSLDAMAVGLSLAFIDMDLAGILAVSAGIGMATFVMSTAGVLLGKAIGNRFGRYAEMVAGVVLCALGTMILIDHIG